MASLQHVSIPNTCCPICGTGIEPDMPEVRLKLSDAERVSVRVDSERCAAFAAARPDLVANAARVNQIAHEERRRPPASTR
jgi:hypothetical protein